MKLLQYAERELIPLDIPEEKKLTIFQLIKNYDLTVAQKVIFSCNTSNDNINATLFNLATEIDKHIEIFNDDLEQEEVIYQI